MNDDEAADRRAQRAEAGVRLDRLVGGLLDHAGVGRTTMFGSAAISLNGKLFALLDREGRLMVKVPAERAAALVAQGAAVPARIGRGTAREWVGIAPEESGTEDQDREWTEFLLEAYDYAVQLQADSAGAASD
ncbi:TfoX/Sxy family protein [Arthrobacter burdickii]|uniref:TfoX/Sxy family protein n=1 Tax=Arthrobacter burdickii TaxID=3035920 RepID=A0ABT8JY37_9MICC|nr:TfoX/Sxy family protein [Arthrobacter burdickii]MDN4610074.1 TfoX/Sxy family protein [Arthrobacter burdickii]